ncbi:hypothetical protein CLV51_107177 [Chitinophaga niastensis]|uniref:Uncharacterized protein n=1 Tax=Chitinophaga niastensis TaxID=536980 RepID=A0A2P8HCA9_CHINA|nr:hypothetical protein [Chitinophaga niastensis]PSL43866.1 hypothetical protein CLV51_107177 [Chitinophaga niastensis]
MSPEHTPIQTNTTQRSNCMQENIGAKGIQLPAVVAPLQRVIIPDFGKKPLPDEEVWDEVKLFLEDVPISRDHEQWMRKYMGSSEMKNKSFETYEDVGEFLLKKVNAQFNTSYTVAEEEDAQEEQEPKKQGLLSAGMSGLVKYLAIFSAVQAIGSAIPGAEAHGLPAVVKPSVPALGAGSHGTPGSMNPIPLSNVCPPPTAFGNSSVVPASLPVCPVPQAIPSPSYNVGSLANLVPFNSILTTETGAGAIRNSATYRDKIGLDKPAEDRSIAPEEVDYLQGASSEEFIGRFTPYALAILKSNRVAQTEKANAMSHFNYQAYMTTNQGAEQAKVLGDAHERFEKGRPQEGVKSEELPDSIADKINNARARVLAEAYKSQMPGINEQIALAAMHKLKLSFDALREKVTASPRISLEPFVQRDFVDVLFQYSWERGHLAKAVPHDKDYIKKLSPAAFQEHFITPLSRLWHDYGVTGLFTKVEMEELLTKDPKFPEREQIPVDRLMLPDKAVPK